MNLRQEIITLIRGYFLTPVIANLANKWIRLLQKQNIDQTENTSRATITEMQEMTKLIQIQIKNQERIISLLEEIKENALSL